MLEFENNRSRVATEQPSFNPLSEQEKRLNSLEVQASYLHKDVLILRNLLAKEYLHVKEGMSKYNLDYMKALEGSLKVFRKAIDQMKSTLPD